jgi:uncharacterized protein
LLIYTIIYTRKVLLMEFQWDQGKNAANIAKHGFDFADGAEMFEGKWPFLVAADLDEEYGEERWKGIGMIHGRIAVAIFSEPTPGLIRFISLRKANQEERNTYEKTIKDELEAH